MKYFFFNFLFFYLSVNLIANDNVEKNNTLFQFPLNAIKENLNQLAQEEKSPQNKVKVMYYFFYLGDFRKSAELSYHLYQLYKKKDHLYEAVIFAVLSGDIEKSQYYRKIYYQANKKDRQSEKWNTFLEVINQFIYGEKENLSKIEEKMLSYLQDFYQGKGYFYSLIVLSAINQREKLTLDYQPLVAEIFYRLKEYKTAKEYFKVSYQKEKEELYLLGILRCFYRLEDYKSIIHTIDDSKPEEASFSLYYFYLLSKFKMGISKSSLNEQIHLLKDKIKTSKDKLRFNQLLNKFN